MSGAQIVDHAHDIESRKSTKKNVDSGSKVKQQIFDADLKSKATRIMEHSGNLEH